MRITDKPSAKSCSDLSCSELVDLICLRRSHCHLALGGVFVGGNDLGFL